MRVKATSLNLLGMAGQRSTCNRGFSSRGSEYAGVRRITDSHKVSETTRKEKPCLLTQGFESKLLDGLKLTSAA